MNFIEITYFFCFALVTGTAFAFMWRSMDLVFREIDKPSRRIHPELKDVKPGDELLVFEVKKEED